MIKKFFPYNFVFDNWLLATVLPLIAIGLLMVASASMVVSYHQYHYHFHFLLRQIDYLLIGGIIGWGVLHIPLKKWQDSGVYLLLTSLLLLVLVLIPGIGHKINGSSRWLGFGIFTFQVSELIKLWVIVYLAGYLVRHQQMVRATIIGFINPLAILAIISSLLLLEPDFGATGVVVATALGMMFLAGVRTWQFMVLLSLIVVIFSLLAILSPYRLQRLVTFLDPWANPFDSGYQLTQSLIAFGRGGIFGTGLGNSIQKLSYLPEAHTDFLFAVLAEELGLVGQLLVLGLLAIFVGRSLYLAFLAYTKGQLFTAYFAFGLSLWIGLQAMINIGVNIGMLPTKGLTLPFISYGGSSMLLNCIVVAILLRVSYEIANLNLGSNN